MEYRETYTVHYSFMPDGDFPEEDTVEFSVRQDKTLVGLMSDFANYCVENHLENVLVHYVEDRLENVLVARIGNVPNVPNVPNEIPGWKRLTKEEAEAAETDFNRRDNT